MQTRYREIAGEIRAVSGQKHRGTLDIRLLDRRDFVSDGQRYEVRPIHLRVVRLGIHRIKCDFVFRRILAVQVTSYYDSRFEAFLKASFVPREGFDPSELHTATTARIWYSPAVARWEVEKGARPLVDGAALADKSVGSADWLVGEVVAYRGEAIVLEPQELRERVATRARELQRELKRTTAKA